MENIYLQLLSTTLLPSPSPKKKKKKMVGNLENFLKQKEKEKKRISCFRTGFGMMGLVLGRRSWGGARDEKGKKGHFLGLGKTWGTSVQCDNQF